MSLKWFVAAALSAVMIGPVSADDTKGAKKDRKKQQRSAMATQLIKRLQEVKLTDDQVAKIKELGKVAGVKSKEIREQAGITQEIIKKRAEAQKSLKDSGKKGKQLQAAINEQAELTEQQAKAMNELAELRSKLQQDAIALLTDDQKQILPKRLQRAAKNSVKKKKNKAD